MIFVINDLDQSCLIVWKKMYKYEHQLWQEGKKIVAGCDEVGRGPLAGPVVACAVVLEENVVIEGLDDSKKLSEKKRKQLYDKIQTHAKAIGVAFITPQEIDEINIYQASKKAMMIAIESLPIRPDFVLSDAMPLSELGIPYESIIKGDQKSASIAAASIIAKVTRDEYMKKLGETFPAYGFAKHKGYPTKAHKEALKKHGVTIHHRKSYAPVQEALYVQEKLDL